MSQIKAANTPENEKAKAALWEYLNATFEQLIKVSDNKQWDQAKILVEKMRLIVLGLP